MIYIAFWWGWCLAHAWTLLIFGASAALAVAAAGVYLWRTSDEAMDAEDAATLTWVRDLMDSITAQTSPAAAAMVERPRPGTPTGLEPGAGVPSFLAPVTTATCPGVETLKVDSPTPEDTARTAMVAGEIPARPLNQGPGHETAALAAVPGRESAAATAQTPAGDLATMPLAGYEAYLARQWADDTGTFPAIAAAEGWGNG